MSTRNWFFVLLFVIGTLVDMAGGINLPSMSSILSPDYVSVKDLALGSSHEGHIVSEGFSGSANSIMMLPAILGDETFAGNSSYYLWSYDLNYNVEINGNIPPANSGSCGTGTLPYYRVNGTIYKIPGAPHEKKGITVSDYTQISCRRAGM